MRKAFYILLFCLASTVGAYAQSIIAWEFTGKKTGKNEATLYFTAIIDEGWHLYSMQQEEGGPVPTSIELESSNQYEVVGKIIEPTPLKELSSIFMTEVGYFEKKVVFTQKIKLKSKKATIKGTVHFMACDDMQCIPPITTPFNIVIE